MSEKFCLSVTYNDGRRYERKFNKLADIPPFIKENFLKYGIASIVFAEDMSVTRNKFVTSSANYVVKIILALALRHIAMENHLQ